MTLSRTSRNSTGSGFSLIELMIGTLLFAVIAGAVFDLLGASIQRYQMEKDALNSFQQANVAIDQITRDVHSAGYPPANSFTSSVAAANPAEVAQPFAWSPNYPATPCIVGVCTSPGSFDLITETNPGDGSGVQWIRYSLQGTTLMRGVASKATNTDPITATTPALVPYLENVMNNCSAAQMAALQQDFPTMFPGNAAVPIFTYTYDGGVTQPPYIREVNITLIVQSQRVDERTQKYRVVTLTGQALRINPNQ